MFKILDDIVRHSIDNEKSQWIELPFVLIIAAIGFAFNLPWGIQRAFVALLFFWSGKVFCNKILNGCLAKNKFVTLGLAVVSCAAVYALSKINPTSMVASRWGNPALFVLSALLGTFMVLAASKWVDAISNRFADFFAAIGRESMWIMCGHLFAMYIFFAITNQNILIHFKMSTNLWQALVCLICGIFLPYLASKSWNKVIAFAK